MKPGIFMFRFLSLVFVCSVFQLAVNAHIANPDFKSKVNAETSQIKNIPADHKIYSTSDSVAKRLLAPVINLTVASWQSRIALLIWTTSDPALDGTYFVERKVALSPTWDLLMQLPYNAVLAYNDTIHIARILHSRTVFVLNPHLQATILSQILLMLCYGIKLHHRM
jgi:hypothetical protein